MKREQNVMPVIDAVTAELGSGRRKVRVHGLCAGITQDRVRGARWGVNGLFSDWLGRGAVSVLPCWVWLIEHPEGLFLVDTGAALDPAAEGSRQLNPLGYQMGLLGMRPADVRCVVLTHIGATHTGGLRYFPFKQVLVSERELERNRARFSSVPLWFRPSAVSLQPLGLQGIDAGYPLTLAGDLLLVATPGHTPGHSSVLLQTDEGDFLFAGDLSQNEDQLMQWVLPRHYASADDVFASYNQVRSYALHRRMVYLPTHDPAATQRLRTRQFFREPA